MKRRLFGANNGNNSAAGNDASSPLVRAIREGRRANVVEILNRENGEIPYNALKTARELDDKSMLATLRVYEEAKNVISNNVSGNYNPRAIAGRNA